ncbi:MAG TPA: glycoside hydrolase family 15 protein [Candidatus Acidoferrales bacterium]|nr:glycoside hydrolase family 15 protein [Candidatus Acidoferrales bacterium]
MKAQPARIARSKAGNTLKSIAFDDRKKSAKKDGAFGRPGIEPRWTHGDKDAVGTSYAASSRIWFTLWNGIITEVYYPTVDHPQIRDLQFLITDGKTFFHEERRDLKSKCERLSDHTLGYRITNLDPSGRYTIVKEIITDPHLACILQHVRLGGNDAFISKLRLYTLCAPHLQVGGWGNNGYVIDVASRKILMARKKGIWMALGGTVQFSRVSCGYVGRSDGWTDLASNFQMDWQFGDAPDGNVALTGELDLDGNHEFTMGLAFGDTEHCAITNLFQALGIPFKEQLKRYTEQWDRTSSHLLPLEKFSSDKGNLYHSSFSLLLAHEDKSYPGALIASLSIPWGEAKGDADHGGYHLVWTRDMVSSASAMLAAGDRVTPLRALIYLAVSQQQDGGFAQNFWVDGGPFWRGIQLDEVAFPILLAWQLQREEALQDFDPYPMVLKAAAYLMRHGPVTQQERWEEASGYSPSTLASNIAALIGAAWFARDRGDEAVATLLEDYADFLECHIEGWTVTTEGSLVPGIKRHYIRILPEDVDNADPLEDPNSKVLEIKNHPAGAQDSFPAKDIIDAGFLQLVRYGIRRPDDPLILDSLKIIDAVLKVDTSVGPVWHRYNHDGYGQREDGGPYIGWGKGRAWPLLTGERAHYELSAGHDVKPFIRAIEGFASTTGLLPEQVWDEPDRPEAYMFLGRPTGSAMPLMWAHAEYVKLLRSVSDGSVFDLIPEVANRYLRDRKTRRSFEIWKPNRQARSVKRGYTLRIQVPAAFSLHWSVNEWQSAEDSPSSAQILGFHIVDIPISNAQRPPIRFTFFWTVENRWEGRDYVVAVE